LSGGIKKNILFSISSHFSFTAFQKCSLHRLFEKCLLFCGSAKIVLEKEALKGSNIVAVVIG
jgi:hypothetical protein